MKPRLLFQDIVSTITGFSTPVFGMQWTPPTKEKDIAKSVVTFLEDRRVLYNSTELEVPHHCISSVLEIRDFLTKKIDELNQSNELDKNLRAMRAACRKFLDYAQEHGDEQVSYRNHHVLGNYYSRVFGSYLGEMRGIFGFCLAQIVLSYELDMEAGLASILPAKD